MASLGAGDLCRWVGILTPPVEQHKAGGRLELPWGSLPRTTLWETGGQLLWQPGCPPRAASECSGVIQTPRGWVLAESEHLICGTNEEEPLQEADTRLQGRQRPSYSLATYPGPLLTTKSPPQVRLLPHSWTTESVGVDSDVRDDVSDDNLLPL